MEQHQVLYCLKRIFSEPRGDSSYCYPTLTSYENSDLFQKYYELFLESGTKQIPVFKSAGILKEFTHAPCKIVIPLFFPKAATVRKTYGTIIRDFFTRSTPHVMSKITTPNNAAYYGSTGIILDESFNPLFIAFYDIEPCSSQEDSEWKVSGITIKISPNVFLNTDKLLEKSIVNKIIPLYLSDCIDVYTTRNLKGGKFYPKIIIEDLSNYIKSAPEPLNYKTMNEDLNSFLCSRIDEDITALRNE